MIFMAFQKFLVGSNASESSVQRYKGHVASQSSVQMYKGQPASLSSVHEYKGQTATLGAVFKSTEVRLQLKRCTNAAKIHNC